MSTPNSPQRQNPLKNMWTQVRTFLTRLVSGSIFGGVSRNKITAIAGESSTGKTFFSLAVVKNFLDSNPDGYCLYFDTEAAVNRGLLESRGIDLERLVVVNVVTIEEFRSKALRAVDIYLKTEEGNRKPCMFVLDSLGMLSTEKEIRDALDDKQVRDMTKSQLVKGAFRMLTLKLGQANIPLIVTNHTYDVIGSYVPTKEMGGGSGLKYAASTIIYLSKAKEKEGTEVVGNIIKAKTAKSRLSKENKEVKIRLYYDERGLDRYYGLLELGELGGLWKNVAGRYEIDGKKVYAKKILASPEEYFTDEVMAKLEEIAGETFSFMDKFIKTYEVFDETLCQSIIEIFETSQQQRVDNAGVPNFTQVNINSSGKYGKFVKLLCYKTVDILKKYKKDLPEYIEWFPDKFYFEEFRIKKYNPGKVDQFGLHTDVQDHMTAKRYLAFLFYLNDDFVGGETDFPYNELTVTPETGKVLVFPPTWQYPHRGLHVKGGSPKYIMSTYLHYQ